MPFNPIASGADFNNIIDLFMSSYGLPIMFLSLAFFKGNVSL